jgi:hypothetical protein
MCQEYIESSQHGCMHGCTPLRSLCAQCYCISIFSIYRLGKYTNTHSIPIFINCERTVYRGRASSGASQLCWLELKGKESWWLIGAPTHWYSINLAEKSSIQSTFHSFSINSQNTTLIARWYSGTCLLRSPLGLNFLAVIDRWLL